MLILRPGLCAHRRRVRFASLAFVLFAVLPVSALAAAQSLGDVAPKRWVLLPNNVEDVPPEYLADGTETLDAVLAAELERREVVFVQLTLVDGLRRWMRATDAIGGLLIDIDGVKEESVQQAQRQLVELLLEEFDATGVIWPDVHERKASKKRRSLVWDRVSRIIPGLGSNMRAHSPNLGSSLRVRIFGSDAELVSDEYHGLEVIHRYQELRRKSSEMIRTIWWINPVRTDLFEDRKLLGRAAQRLLPSELP